ncbi:hypothetical protein K2Q08_03175 [Patescibacteria group bacterium]|nr:hypothetical protein [Patescibacteria group bacterium]
MTDQNKELPPSARAVRRALAEIDRCNLSTPAPTLQPALKLLIDAVLDYKKTNSDKPALLFLLAYKAENNSWNFANVPKGWRPGDKVLCSRLTELGLTLHGNITAYAENMGIKGDASGYNLFGRKRLGQCLEFLSKHERQVRQALKYVAWRFKSSYRPQPEMVKLTSSDMTYTRALRKVSQVLLEESGGHFQQFMVASLLRAFHEQWETGREVTTHHPHAADKSDRVAGDIEEIDETGRVLDAYEVTVRPDWKNRRQDLIKKMQKFSLSRYTVICRINPTDPDLSTPAALHAYMSPLGLDIAVVDIQSFAESCLASLTRERRAAVFQYMEEYVHDTDLCGVPNLIDKLTKVLQE